MARNLRQVQLRMANAVLRAQIRANDETIRRNDETILRLTADIMALEDPLQ
jgi:hypothetical protein